MFKQEGGSLRTQANFYMTNEGDQGTKSPITFIWGGIELALINGDIHIGEDCNDNPKGSMTEITISELLNNKAISQQFKMAFQQQTKLWW